MGNGVGLLFAILAFTLSVVSFPLLLDREANVETTVKTSVTAAIKNSKVRNLLGITSCPLRGSVRMVHNFDDTITSTSEMCDELRGNIRGAFVLDPDGNRPRARQVALGVKQAGEIDEASRCHVVLRAEHPLHDR